MKPNRSLSSISTGRDSPTPARCNQKIVGLRRLVVLSGLILIAAGCSGGGGGGSSGSGGTPTTPMTWDQGTWDQVTWN